MTRHTIKKWTNAKVLFSDARLRILDLVRDEALSLSNLVEILDLNPGSVHNHIQKLLNAGLVIPVEREVEARRGAPEKRYRAVAKEIIVGDLGDDNARVVRAVSKRAAQDTREILDASKASQARRVEGYLSRKELEEVRKTLENLMEKFASTPQQKTQKRVRFYYTIGEIE